MPDLNADYRGILEPGPPSFQGLLAARTVALVQADLQVPQDTRLGDLNPVGRIVRITMLLQEVMM